MEIIKILYFNAVFFVSLVIILSASTIFKNNCAKTMSYTLTDIINNPNIGIEIGKEIESMSWIKSPFEPLVGQGSDRGIRSYQIANKQPFRPRLKARLTGTGVQDNEEFQTNYDEMEIKPFTQKLVVMVY